MSPFSRHSQLVQPASATTQATFSKFHLLEAIQKARDAGLQHWCAALVTIYKREFPNK